MFDGRSCFNQAGTQGQVGVYTKGFAGPSVRGLCSSNPATWPPEKNFKEQADVKSY